jgi:aspartyl-tRNA(Asn)/glutamyl-tRNA(Gln) amidotransferase subunit C
MSEITPESVRHLASLARIALTEDEIASLTTELGAIVDAVATVQQAAGDDVPATSHPIPLAGGMRVDEPGTPLATADALAGAPDSDGTRFRVTAILGEEQ